MSEYRICTITKEGIDDAADMLDPEIVSLVKRDLPVTALAVVSDGTIVGALGGLIDTDTFDIVSMYVLPEERRKGAGTALMKKLFELADDEELIVRAEYTPLDSEGETIAPFLVAMDFYESDVVFPVYCVKALRDIAIDAKALPPGIADLTTFAEAGDKKVRAAFEAIEEQDGIHVEVEKFEDLIDKNISFIALEKGEFRGCVLGQRLTDDLFKLSILWALEPDKENAMLMIAFALDEIRKTAGPDTRIVIPVTDAETKKVTEEILGTPDSTTLRFEKSRFVKI